MRAQHATPRDHRKIFAVNCMEVAIASRPFPAPRACPSRRTAARQCTMSAASMLRLCLLVVPRNSHLRSPTLDHAQLGRRQPQSDKCSPLEAAVSCDPEVKGGHCCSTTDCCSTAANDVRTTRRPPRVQGRCLAYDSSAHSRPCRRRDLGRSPVSPLPASRDRSPRIPIATTASARAGTDAQSTLAATPSGRSRLPSPSATASASAPTC